jgi:sugar/nucleoside kinase (ribokinase family)
MPPGLLCCGNVVMDVLVRPVDRIAWNTTTWVEAIEQHMGGNGASTSCAAAASGVPVRLISVAGRDAFGDELLRRLAAVGVDTSDVQRYDAPTPATVALVNSAGDRLFLHRVGAGAHAFAEPPEFGDALTSGMSRFHLANPFALPGLRRHAGEIVRRAEAAGLATSVDTGWDAQGRWMEDLGPCLGHTGLLFVNQDEAQALSGTSDPGEAAHRFRQAGVQVVVVKLGARGCAVFGPGGEARVPAFDVPAVDTTGAGDCFAGAFLAALQRGLSHTEAARFANAAAALAVQQLGATAGLRSWAETRAWMESAPVRSV